MIRIYPLDGKMMSSRENMHAHLYMQFGLPEYYGCNLDAFWDCITDKEPGVIAIRNMEQADRRCFLPLVGLLMSLAEQNPAWHISIESGTPDCENDSFDSCNGDCASCTQTCLSDSID